MSVAINSDERRQQNQAFHAAYFSRDLLPIRAE
jgi:hypothetical protein